LEKGTNSVPRAAIVCFDSAESSEPTVSATTLRKRSLMLASAGFSTGRERTMTALTSVKMAVLAPIPSASVSVTTSVNKGALTRVLAPYRRSR